VSRFLGCEAKPPARVRFDRRNVTEGAAVALLQFDLNLWHHSKIFVYNHAL
jgi:hypothetical protein